MKTLGEYYVVQWIIRSKWVWFFWWDRPVIEEMKDCVVGTSDVLGGKTVARPIDRDAKWQAARWMAL
jgi:hypothetical protein